MKETKISEVEHYRLLWIKSQDEKDILQDKFNTISKLHGQLIKKHTSLKKHIEPTIERFKKLKLHIAKVTEGNTNKNKLHTATKSELEKYKMIIRKHLTKEEKAKIKYYVDKVY